MLGDKFFKEFLMLIGNYKTNMSMLDVLDRLEKLEMIEDANAWLMYRNLRNTLTHEYPDNEAEIISGIKIALDVFFEIERIYQKMISYLNDKHLIL